MYLTGITLVSLSSPLKFQFVRSGSLTVLYSVLLIVVAAAASLAKPTCTSPEARTLTAVAGVTSSTFLNEMLFPSTVILFAFNLPRLIISPAAELAVVPRGFVPLFANSFNCASVRLLVERYRFPTSTLALEPNKIPLGLMR